MADSLLAALEELNEQELRASEYASDAVLVIDNDLRTIAVPRNFIFGVYNDKNVLSVNFEMPRTYDDVDLSDFTIQINYLAPNKVGNVYEVTDPVVGEDKITFEWLLDRGVFLSSGTVEFTVCLREIGQEGAIIREFNTTIAKGTVLAGLEIEDPEDPEAYSLLAHIKQMDERVTSQAATVASDYAKVARMADEIEATAEELADDVAEVKEKYGSPLVAPTAAGMIDHTRIYVYTGSETGYTFGNWYYYDGTAWTSGGVYNSAGVNTDSTLSVSGMPADAKKTGDEISGLKEDLNLAPAIMGSDATDVDLDVTDSSGNVVARFANGGIETKEFRGYKYIEFKKDGTTTNQSVTVTINHDFKRGDKIVLHTDRGAYPYNAPWNAGVRVTYYEDDRPIISDARIDIAYIEHTITEDTSSISVEYDGTLSTGRQTVTLHVYLLGDIPITPEIIKVKTDGTGDYTSLRDAVDAIGLKADDYIHPYVIEVYPGTYDVLADYDDEEINTAISSFTDVSFVGLKLLNGVSLVGVGNPDNIILTSSLSTSDYSAEVRGGISTINKQGSGSIENVTIVSHNLRYCVHDDFGSQYAKRIKRIYRNCIFRAYNSAYTPDTSYGAGMPIGGMDAEFINCDFGENGGLHLNSQLTSFVTIRLKNCKGLGFRISDNTTVTNTTLSEYVFENCDFEYINYSLAGESPHARLRGSGNKPMLMNVPSSVMYAMDSVIPVPITRLNVDIGDVVERYAINTHGPRYQLATSIDKACGIVVFKDESDVYIQTTGYVRTDRAELSSFNLNDYIGLSNGKPTVVQNAADAFGRIKFIDSDNNGYIYLNWR